MNSQKTLLTLSILFSFAIANAQKISVVKPLVKTPTKVKAIQFSLGASWDKYSNMSMAMIEDRTKSMPEYKNKVEGMKENITFSSGGLHSGIGLVLNSSVLNNEVINTEWRIGASITLGKEALIEYHTPINSKDYTSLMYCFVENDAKLNSDLIFRFGGTNRFNFYTGMGVNLSGSFNNNLLILQNYVVRTGVVNNFSESESGNHDKNTFSGKSVAYGRAYIPVGVSVKWFRHFESSVEYQFGRGLEQVFGGDLTGFRTKSFTLSLRYNIQKNSTPTILDFF